MSVYFQIWTKQDRRAILTYSDNTKNNIKKQQHLPSVYIQIYNQARQTSRVWSCLVTDNFGLFTGIVCKFLHGLQSWGVKLFFFLSPLYVFIRFSAAFCMMHCALGVAKDHAP